jgi:hypothetical protein
MTQKEFRVRLVNSMVESIGPDVEDPFGLVIRLQPVAGLPDPILKIARVQIDSFLAVLGLASQSDLIGRGVQMTVDDETGSERIAFLTSAEAAQAAEAAKAGELAPAAEPVATEAAQAVEPAQAVESAVAEPVEAAQAAEPAESAAVEPAQPVEAVEPSEVAAPIAAVVAEAPSMPLEPAAPVESAAFAVAAPVPDIVTAGTAVMAAPPFADEITVYDGVRASRAAPPTDAECADGPAALTPDQQAIEAAARAALAAAAGAPLDARYFLYRETYERGPRPSVVELTSDEFALLRGTGSYLHVDDCSVVGIQNLSPETVQGIERLLERATSRPEAGLPRAELERLAATGRVVSCAVY